jgi:hypothetical protein
VIVLAVSLFAALLFGARRATAQQLKSAAGAQIEYKNDQYEFCFALPASWKGYSIVTQRWNGAPLDGGSALVGPKLLIRNPAWTAAHPREDIPIMIFTSAEWQRVEKEGVALSAASVGPSELGHNRHYVFALPARFDFDNLPGVEEVDKLVQGKSLKAPC